jgi:hypothetical protein
MPVYRLLAYHHTSQTYVGRGGLAREQRESETMGRRRNRRSFRYDRRKAFQIGRVVMTALLIILLVLILIWLLQ